MILRAVKGIVKLVLYVAFVLAAVYYAPKLLSSALHTPYPMATITSGSMWPVLQENDLIFVKGLKGEDAEIGQIIIYQNDRGFTIHRLVRIEDGPSTSLGASSKLLVTRGDANNIEDKPIQPAQVIGRVVYRGDKPFRLPKLGFLTRYLGPKIQQLEK